MGPLLPDPMEQVLLRVLSRHPDFVTPSDRLRFLLQGLRHCPQGDEIVYQINLYGDPLGVAQTVLQRLEFEGLGPDYVYRLHHLVAYLLEKVRDEPTKEALRAIAAHLEQRAAQKRPESAAVPPPLATRALPDDPQLPVQDEWLGEKDSDKTLEKIIRVNTLRPLYLLERGVRASRGVFRIQGPKPGQPERIVAATGFLVARGIESAPGEPRLALAMTNHHVIPNLAGLAAFEFWFNYRLDIEGEEPDAGAGGFLKATAHPDGDWFVTDPTRDVTLFALADASLPADASALALKEERPLPGARVPIIQHPNGEMMQISFQSNFIEYANDETLHYSTTTLPGSSGSPVFNERFEVIGIHCGGGDLIDPDRPERTVLRNRGTSMKAILPLLGGAIKGSLTVVA